jgi:hypothetical protein
MRGHLASHKAVDHDIVDGPRNGVALTAGGAMRAEDDRRVRQIPA